MKLFKVILLLVVIFLLSACHSGAKLERVEDAEINQQQLTFVTDLSKKILSAQRDGGYYALTEEEATPKMVELLNEQLQKKSYQQIKSAFGDYRDLEFSRMEKPVDGSLYEVYRFKGAFDPKANVEVRATLDANGKLAGFLVRPWKD